MNMILLIGASASGKTEIAKRLSTNYGIKKATTHTTRKMRQGERQDVDYHFVDEATFAEMERNGEFVETTFYNGNHYGCSKAELGLDRCIVVDPVGVSAYLALGDPNLVTFFLEASPETRKARMESRGDDPELIQKRLQGDATTFDLKNVPPCDFIIDSNTETVAALTEKIVRLYHQKIGH